MSADNAFVEIFQIGGRKKFNSTGKLRSSHARAKAQRVAGGSPEVVVKITGYGKKIGQPAAHIKYISRNGKLELENERGEILGKEDIQDLAKSWTADFSDAKRHKNQRDTLNMFFSMPPGTPPEDVRSAVRDFLKEKFSYNHEYVFALHTDQPHPHVHTSIKMVGFNGKRLDVNPDDLQGFREAFAENLRRLGVDAEATPREIRGVVKKPENLIVRHIQAGDKTHPPRVPKVKAGLVREAVDELIAENSGSQVLQKPWENSIQDRQKKVRAAWRDAATNLSSGTQKILRNENGRPDYEQPRASYAGVQRRVAALYQSSFIQTPERAATGTHPGVRDLPPIHVVHKSIVSSLLVHENASINMGLHDGTRNDLRRAGFIPNAASRAAKKTNGKGYSLVINHDSDAALADKINGFLNVMPAAKTLMQETKERLRTEYTKQPTAAQVKAPDRQRQGERSATHQPQLGQQKKPDLER